MRHIALRPGSPGFERGEPDEPEYTGVDDPAVWWVDLEAELTEVVTENPEAWLSGLGPGYPEVLP